MNFEKGDGWNKLCKFLNVPEPDIPFPHVFSAKKAWRNVLRKKETLPVDFVPMDDIIFRYKGATCRAKKNPCNN